MTPVYLNSPPSPFTFIELKEDHHQQMQFLSATPQYQGSSSFSPPIFFNITQDHRSTTHSIEPPKNINDQCNILQNSSSDDHQVPQAYSMDPIVASRKDNNGIVQSICKNEGDEVDDKRDYQYSAKWISKKIRLVHKMMNKGSDHHEKQDQRVIKIKIRDHKEKDICDETNSPNSSSSNIVRICSDCKTTKTPLWRSGPQGPKSLCNACGIRQRKARRKAMLDVAANGTVKLTTENSTRTCNKVQKREKKASHSSYHVAAPYKKRFGGPPNEGGGERTSFEDFALSLSKSLAFRRAFPKDEEEAAILLMALSSGLLHT